MKFSVFQLSRQGGRQLNEDRMGYCYTRESGLFILADGMGGHPEGEVAAQLALQVLSTQFQKAAQPLIADPPGFLAAALLAANQQILRYASARAMLDTPRTTLVAALLQNGCACWIHCGDSRLYWVRDGELLGRTRDHSYVEQGGIGLLKQSVSNRNILFTCLGSPGTPVYDISATVTLRQGDRLLLCSDGLWGSLDDDTIVRGIGHGKVGDAVPDLVDLALERAGSHSDNVTVVALEWEMPDAFDSTQSGAGRSDADFASTIQGAALESSDAEFDDAAIERSIAEINAAIRRTGRR